ncbi:hypothetical protein HYQ46_009328 [Verticillium longisporum]|nr:hypothetical protein HYQ46_009328 [Verticillium longisporum]
MAQREGPLFLHNIEGLVLPEVGVAAVQVDEFARHVFMLLWGVDDVERWAVTTGDEVTVVFRPAGRAYRLLLN